MNITNTNFQLTDGKEIEFPPILYKYKDWDNPNHKKLLTDTTLYLASPQSFEDIKDCNIPEKFPKKEELYKLFLEISHKEHPTWTRRVHRRYAAYWSKRSPLANPQLLKKNLEYLKKQFNDCFGVLSMTANSNNDMMWSKYANNHKGFCVGYSTDLLFKYVGGGGPVQYKGTLPTIDFVKDDYRNKILKNIFFKEKKWSFEEEYRLHTMWPQYATADLRNIKLPKECVIEIILGKHMTKDNKDEIKRIANILYPKAKITEKC